MPIDGNSPQGQLLRAAYRGRLESVQNAINDGADVNTMTDEIGLSALHMAVGRGHLDVVKYLVEKAGAVIQPDSFGRWPTIIAAECKVSAEVCDYIVEREAELVGIAEPDFDR